MSETVPEASPDRSAVPAPAKKDTKGSVVWREIKGLLWVLVAVLALAWGWLLAGAGRNNGERRASDRDAVAGGRFRSKRRCQNQNAAITGKHQSIGKIAGSPLFLDRLAGIGGCRRGARDPWGCRVGRAGDIAGNRGV